MKGLLIPKKYAEKIIRKETNKEELVLMLAHSYLATKEYKEKKSGPARKLSGCSPVVLLRDGFVVVTDSCRTRLGRSIFELLGYETSFSAVL